MNDDLHVSIASILSSAEFQHQSEDIDSIYPLELNIHISVKQPVITIGVIARLHNRTRS